MMTTEQRVARINELNKQIFYLECKDRWTSADHAEHRRMCEERRTLAKQEG